MAVERFPVEASHILMFARSIGDSNPIYADQAHAEATEVGGTNEALRASIDTALQKYVAGTFPSAGSAVYPDLTVCISSGLFAPAKFWNGRWCSVWKYAGGKLNGTVKVSTLTKNRVSNRNINLRPHITASLGPCALL